MPKKPKKKLTPNQAAWEKEMKLLRERANYWEKKFRAAFTDFPAKPKKITKEAIERLRNIRWKNLTDEQKQQYRNVYDNMYDDGQIPPNVPNKPYEPPTEDDWYNGETNDWFDTGYEDETPVDSSAEIEKWIEDAIYEIASVEPVDGSIEIPGIADILYKLLTDARIRMGDDVAYKQMLEDNALALNTEARNAKSGSPPRGAYERFGTYTGMSRDQQNSLDRFAEILNAGRPLTKEQSMTLHTEGYVNFDYGEIL